MMVRLNKAQRQMREEYLEKYKKERYSRPDTTEFCYMCEGASDIRDEKGLFTTFIPPITPGKPERGLQMDSMRAVWLCGKCVVRLSS